MWPGSVSAGEGDKDMDDVAWLNLFIQLTGGYGDVVTENRWAGGGMVMMVLVMMMMMMMMMMVMMMVMVSRSRTDLSTTAITEEEDQVDSRPRTSIIALATPSMGVKRKSVDERGG